MKVLYDEFRMVLGTSVGFDHGILSFRHSCQREEEEKQKEPTHTEA